MTSNLALYLRTLLDSEQLSARQVAADAEIGYATFHRLLSGERPVPKTLRAVILAITKVPKVQAEILMTHLVDELDRTGIQQDRIQISQNGKTQSPIDRLDPARREQLEFLIKSILQGNRELSLVLEDLANLVGFEPSNGFVYPTRDPESLKVAEDNPKPTE